MLYTSAYNKWVIKTDNCVEWNILHHPRQRESVNSKVA